MVDSTILKKELTKRCFEVSYFLKKQGRSRNETTYRENRGAEVQLHPTIFYPNIVNENLSVSFKMKKKTKNKRELCQISVL